MTNGRFTVKLFQLFLSFKISAAFIPPQSSLTLVNTDGFRIIQDQGTWQPEASLVLPVDTSSLVTSNAVEVVQSFAITLGGVLAVLAVLVVLFVKIIVPQAAEQLEKQARVEYPDLWREYADKLAPGEKLIQRPDIMQELGNKVQARALADFERQQQQSQQKSTRPSAAPTNTTSIDEDDTD